MTSVAPLIDQKYNHQPLIEYVALCKMYANNIA